MEYVTLSNGVKMPMLGYGVYQVTKEECERCVLDAIKVGYRSIDTPQSYFNEEEVGNSIEKCGVRREELFITTKVWIEHYGYEETKASVLESMKKFKVDYLDLCLLHQPLGVILVVLGVFNMRGNIALIHWYNRRKDSKENQKAYCFIVGLGTLFIGIAIFAAGIIQVFIDIETSAFVMLGGIVVGLLLILYAQLKYNRGIF